MTVLLVLVIAFFTVSIGFRVRSMWVVARKPARTGVDKMTFLFALIETAFLVGTGVASVLQLKYHVSLFAVLTRLVGLHLAQLIAAAAVVVLGVCAHWFKRMNQQWYGLCEVLFAMAVAFQVASSMQPGLTALSQWATLGGATYVVARGLNNISDARAKKQTVTA